MIGSGLMGKTPAQIHNFATSPRISTPRSSFDLSHKHLTAFDSSYLVPILATEVYPGDTHSMTISCFVRLSTPLRPVMDNGYIDIHCWSVPLRLLQKNWVKLMGEQDNPDDTISYLTPTMTSPTGGPAVGSLSDYIGIPTAGQIDPTKTVTFNSWWHRAYNFIYNNDYRDQNLQDSVPFSDGDGPDTYADYVLLKSGKRHDYFTSCLPEPQKFDPVSIPMGTTAPVIGIGKANQTYGGAQSAYETGGTGSTAYASGQGIGGTADTQVFIEEDPNNPGYPNIRADLSAATAATINSLRQAFAVQQLLELDARGGTRYPELILAHWNVVSPDFRQQRPEYLGGGTASLNFYPVPQTSATGMTGTPQANLAGMAVISASGMGFTKSFTEHGVILVLARVRADLTYQQGLHRQFSRQTRLDYPFPQLANIGEQAVPKKEIYCDGNTGDEETFGYQERFAELRYMPSRISSKFRSTASGTMDVWHLSQKFTTRPSLSDTFIKEAVPFDRVVAVNTEPQFIGDFYFKWKAARVLPVRGVPGLLRM